MSVNPFFPEIHRNFGFGCMRLPPVGEEVDLAQTKEMVDYFLENGFNYFDTAHGYFGGAAVKPPCGNAWWRAIPAAATS